jgi:hypothetical protein
MKGRRTERRDIIALRLTAGDVFGLETVSARFGFFMAAIAEIYSVRLMSGVIRLGHCEPSFSYCRGIVCGSL